MTGSALPRPSLGRARRYFARALRLVCPECGVSPIFLPAARVRSLGDWFRPLEGCPRCGYRYERENGYFLLATWAVNYGMAGGLGIVLMILSDLYLPVSLPVEIVAIAVPVALLSLLTARHSKAFFLALDHCLDPQGDEPDGKTRDSP